jgi:ATP-dependent DNA helicase RecQ
VPDAKTIAQKILSCVFRVQERFGVNHVVEVLLGSKTQNVIQRGHDKLSTYGLLRDISKAQLRDWVYQLIGQGALELDGSEYPILKLNAASRTILFGDAEPRLIRTATTAKERKQASVSHAAEFSDTRLFEKLRILRRRIAQEQNVPPFVVFSDSVLIEMSAYRPSTLDRMLNVSGIGKVKLNSYGNVFLETIRQHCEECSVAMDVEWKKPGTTAVMSQSVRSGTTSKKSITIPMLRQGCDLAEIAAAAEITTGTVVSHLLDLMQEESIPSIDGWVPVEVQRKIIEAADAVGREKLKPIYEHLQQSVDYERIRLVLSFEKQQTAT